MPLLLSLARNLDEAGCEFRSTQSKMLCGNAAAASMLNGQRSAR